MEYLHHILYSIFIIIIHQDQTIHIIVALRPVITVPGNCVSNKTIGAVVETDPFYKVETGEAANGYVKADSIASLLGQM